ncbi:MAG TPA: hypothetical protein VHV47_01930 [Opitutaceae bacterium]|jgi:hypothetical protein|nr:hypothetical protein [Opitutaceae bacterium]
MPRPFVIGRLLMLCSLLGPAACLRADLASRSPFLAPLPPAAPDPVKAAAPAPKDRPAPLTEAERKRRDDRMLVTDLLEIGQQQRPAKAAAPAPASK